MENRLFEEFIMEEPIDKADIMLVTIPNVTQLVSQVTERIIEIGRFTQCSKIIASFLPDILLSDDLGRSYLPGLEVFKPKTAEEFKAVLVSSRLQINQLPIPYSYWLAEYLVRKAKNLSVKLVITISDFSFIKPSVRFISNSRELSKNVELKCNIKPMKKFYLTGVSSLIVPISKIYGIKALSLFSLVSNEAQQNKLSSLTFEYLMRLLELTGELEGIRKI